MLRGAVVALLALAAACSSDGGWRTYTMPDGSMTPTLLEGDHLACSRRPPETVGRGAVLAFFAAGTPRVSRVIGLPRETVSGEDGAVRVNGAALDEPYRTPMIRNEPLMVPRRSPDFAPVTVPGDAYLVMGDQRGRFDPAEPELVARRDVVASCTRVVKPVRRRGWIPGTTP